MLTCRALTCRVCATPPRAHTHAYSSHGLQTVTHCVVSAVCVSPSLAAAYAKLGQGLDLDAVEAAATAIGTGSRRREEAVSKKREAAEEADGEGQNKVRGRQGGEAGR